jgi:hypothetical protein
MSTRTTLLLTLGILILAMGISTFFILSRGHVVINRYTDATWHMVAADEFARTGVFAKDPFIQGSSAESVGKTDLLRHPELTVRTESLRAGRVRVSDLPAMLRRALQAG